MDKKDKKGCGIKSLCRLNKIPYYMVELFATIRNHFKGYLKNNIPEEEDLDFIDLTPTKDCDENNQYCKALKWAVDNDNIKNIAVTGSYGSGKSSVLKKFKANNPKYKCLSISLAGFLETSENNQESFFSKIHNCKYINLEDGCKVLKNTVSKCIKSTEGVSIEDNLIELSILQQMTYKSKCSDLPESRIKRICKQNKLKLCALSFFIVILGICASVLFEWSKELNTLLLCPYNDITVRYVKLGMLVFIICMSGFILYNFIKRFSSSKLNKFNIQNGEIDLTEEANPSILNKHLDEIIYNFEVNKYNIVIIEDLDRFDSTSIFTKLREVNTLINESEQVDHKTVFIYAIKDDLFKNDKERTKFFDFILPIIPIINSSNSGGVLQTRLKKHNIDKKFINEVSVYINDMRLLNNIINEFNIYISKVSDCVDINKMLAMIIYKNMMPEDFVALHNYSGEVYNLFQKKKDIIAEEIKQIDKQINEIKRKISIINRTIPTTIRELRFSYISKFLEKAPNADRVRISDRSYRFSDVVSDEAFELFTNCDPIEYFCYNGSRMLGGSLNINFSDFQYEVSELSYKEREGALLQGHNSKIFSLNLEIKTLSDKKKELEDSTLSQLIIKYPNYEFGDKLINQNCLKHLLTHGYVDENCHHYISIFHAGDLLRIDNDYVVAVSAKKAIDENLEITCFEAIIEKLPSRSFLLKESWNYKMIDFLCNNKDIYQEQFDSLLTGFSKQQEFSISFICKYKNQGDKYDILLNELCGRWDKYWDCIYNKSEFTDDQKAEYLIDILKYVDKDYIIGQNNNYNFAEYIANSANLFSLIPDDINDKVNDIILELDILFSNVENIKNKKYINFIYLNNKYQIKKDIIDLMILHDLDGDKSSSYNYSTLFKLKNNCLLDYMNENIEDYIEKVYLNYEDKINEEPNNFISLLGNDSISNEQKQKIIIKNSTVIDNINNINDIRYASLWGYLIGNNNIKATWNNIAFYHNQVKKCHNGTDQIIKFLHDEQNYAEIKNDSIDKDSCDLACIKGLFDALITANVFNIEKYKQINSKFHVLCSCDRLNDLQDDKIKWLIANERLEFGVELLDVLYNRSVELYLLFIAKNENVFLERVESMDISMDKLIEILSYFKSPFCISLIDDINLENYDLNNEIANLICDKYIDGNDYIIYYNLFKILSCSSDINKKLRLFVISLKKDSVLSNDKITNALTLIGGGYDKIANLCSARLYLPNNEDTMLLINALHSKGYIQNVRRSKNKIGFNK